MFFFQALVHQVQTSMTEKEATGNARKHVHHLMDCYITGPSMIDEQSSVWFGDMHYMSSTEHCPVSIHVHLVHLRLSVELKVVLPTETLRILQWLDVNMMDGRMSTAH